ncbi:hypothetical protein D9M68_17600 [compost metagenome]
MLTTLQGFDFTGISVETLKLDEILASPHLYELGLTKFVEFGGIQSLYSPGDYLEHSVDKVIKVEGIERLNKVLFDTSRKLAEYFRHTGPVTCHLFLSPEGSLSFPMHTDTDDVVIYMVKGRKVFEGEHGNLDVMTGESIFIPRGVKHRAVNTNESVMLSFGLERYLEDKL